jgi:hypothetical protein
VEVSNGFGSPLRGPELGKRRAFMMHNPNPLPPAGLRVNEVVVEVLSTTVLVLAGIITFAQFAYY